MMLPILPREKFLTTTTDVQRCDILVNGGGMVGLGLALALAHEGFNVVVLDAQPAPPTPAELRASMTEPAFDSRVSAMTAATQQWLQQLGAWDALAALRVCAYRDMQVWDADGTGAIHFAAEEVHTSVLGHIVENRLLCAVLHAALLQQPSVQVRNGCALETATLATAAGETSDIVCSDGTHWQCRLLIGADGGQSRVRTLAGFATRDWSYGQQAIVATIHSEHAHQHTAWQRFIGSGPLAVLPLQLPAAETQHYSSIVWSCDTAIADELMALPEAAFNQRLQQSFESSLGAMTLVTPRVMFPLHQQHAADYVSSGVALVGDAAHTIHPLAGQGVNLGFSDVRCLVSVLAQAQRRGEDMASLQTLSRYQRERKGPNLAMMLVMEGFKRSFGSDNLALRWLRNAGLRFAARQTLVKRTLIRQAMGLPL
jgi:2-octaprenylphenol hydroxylase